MIPELPAVDQQTMDGLQARYNFSFDTTDPEMLGYAFLRACLNPREVLAPGVAFSREPNFKVDIKCDLIEKSIARQGKATCSASVFAKRLRFLYPWSGVTAIRNRQSQQNIKLPTRNVALAGYVQFAKN